MHISDRMHEALKRRPIVVLQLGVAAYAQWQEHNARLAKLVGVEPLDRFDGAWVERSDYLPGDSVELALRATPRNEGDQE